MQPNCVFRLLLAGLLITLCHPSIAGPRRVDQAQAQRYIEHVKFLASPDLEGRGAGTRGLERAAKYIADHFKQAGLEPAGEPASYLQAFTVTTNAEPGSDNRLLTQDGNQSQTFELGEDYI
ncbi:MAG: hypothetical protein ACRD7E_24370, partial [Bryobacteraceae bacterium]